MLARSHSLLSLAPFFRPVFQVFQHYFTILALTTWKLLIFFIPRHAFVLSNIDLNRFFLFFFYIINSLTNCFHFGETHSYKRRGYTFAMYIEWFYAIKPIGQLLKSLSREVRLSALCTLWVTYRKSTPALLEVTFLECKSRLRLSIVSEYGPQSSRIYELATSNGGCDI
jgi:hypothetical protein